MDIRMITIQVTLISEGGYRPLSTLATVPSWDEYMRNKVAYQQKIVTSMLAKRGMNVRDLRKYQYTQIKARVYDKERIEQEKKARYEQIKKERGWI